MASYNLICLLVDIYADAVKRTTQALWPEIQFTKADYSNSLNDAFQKLVESNYNLCFIHNTFQENLDVFFRDMERLGRHKTCVFVQLWDRLPKDLDLTPILEMGFSAIISRDVSSDEKAALRDVLQLELRRQEIDRRVVDVQEATHFVIRELDRVAREHKRGHSKKFDNLIHSFIGMLTEFDDEVLDQYFDALIEESKDSPTFEVSKLKVPEEVLKRRLPHLDEDSYSGKSHRVWEKLLKHYGIAATEEAQPGADAKPSLGGEKDDPSGTK